MSAVVVGVIYDKRLSVLEKAFPHQEAFVDFLFKAISRQGASLAFTTIFCRGLALFKNCRVSTKTVARWQSVNKRDFATFGRSISLAIVGNTLSFVLALQIEATVNTKDEAFMDWATDLYYRAQAMLMESALRP